jgi:retron-type reverse transcriptase
MHVGKAYVANVDIKDFFPSIRASSIAQLLQANGFGPTLSVAIARLTSLNDGLPQGAPTSPALSNAYLFRLDDFVDRYCENRGAVYTRYADDITISAASRAVIVAAIDELRLHLVGFNLRLNEHKSRIASRAGQQKVTGVVVNEKAQPPREYRRLVRAMFHRAELEPHAGRQCLQELRGHVGYLRSFPTLKGDSSIKRYMDILARLAK